MKDSNKGIIREHAVSWRVVPPTQFEGLMTNGGILHQRYTASSNNMMLARIHLLVLNMEKGNIIPI